MSGRYKLNLIFLIAVLLLAVLVILSSLYGK